MTALDIALNFVGIIYCALLAMGAAYAIHGYIATQKVWMLALAIILFLYAAVTLFGVLKP